MVCQIRKKFDSDTTCIDRNVLILSIIESIYARSMFGPSNIKQSSAILIEGTNKTFWFGNVLLLFLLEAETMIGEFATVRAFDVTSFVDNNNRILSCLCLK